MASALPSFRPLKNVAPGGKLRQSATKIALPPLNFVVSRPTAPDNPTARRIAEIADHGAHKAMKLTVRPTIKAQQ